MLVHRLRRWPTIIPTLGRRLVFTAWKKVSQGEFDLNWFLQWIFTIVYGVNLILSPFNSFIIAHMNQIILFCKVIIYCLTRHHMTRQDWLYNQNRTSVQRWAAILTRRPNTQPTFPVGFLFFRPLLLAREGTAVQRLTAVTAYLKSKQLLLFAFAPESC